MAVLVALSLGSFIQAAQRPSLPNSSFPFQPSWKKESIHAWNPNFSFLNDLRFRQGEGPDWLSDLMDSGVARGIESKYEKINREYEHREYHGLLAPQANEERGLRLTELRKEALEEVRHHQRRKQMSQIRKAIDQDETLQKPASVAAALAAAVTGMPMETSIWDSTHVTLATNVPFQTGYLKMISPVGESRITAAGNPTAGNSWTLPPPDWIARQEHYTFSFSRPLPLLGLGTGVVYGATSNTLNASLSKQLSSALRCTVNSVQFMDTDAASPRPSEESVLFNYEVHF